MRKLQTISYRLMTGMVIVTSFLRASLVNAKEGALGATSQNSASSASTVTIGPILADRALADLNPPQPLMYRIEASDSNYVPMVTSELRSVSCSCSCSCLSCSCLSCTGHDCNCRCG
jgi:hypothetical protein